jgi:hypothetical protein
MSHRLAAVAAVAAVLSASPGAFAADLAGAPPAYAPPSGCVAIDYAPPLLKHGWHKGKPATDYVRIFDVAPYDPRCPQGQPAGMYVPPQAAYLVSSPTRYTECVWPCIDSIHHDWYDGRLWYHNAGTPNRPDVFMILQKD